MAVFHNYCIRSSVRALPSEPFFRFWSWPNIVGKKGHFPPHSCLKIFFTAHRSLTKVLNSSPTTFFFAVLLSASLKCWTNKKFWNAMKYMFQINYLQVLVNVVFISFAVFSQSVSQFYNHIDKFTYVKLVLLCSKHLKMYLK